MAEIDQFITQLDGLIQQLSPHATRQLTREIGTEIRKRNKNRIMANQQPDGSAMVPRKGEATRELRFEEGEQIRKGQRFYYFGDERRLKTLKYLDNGVGYYVGYDEIVGHMRMYRADRIELPERGKNKLRMFRKIHQFKYLKIKSTATEAAVGFMSGLTAYIARQHQDGADHRPERQLIGFSDDDLRFIDETIIRHLVTGQNSR